MHWSEKLASQIIARHPDKEEYVCAAGISPSGSIHIGNFRDVATSYFVCRALRKMGKKARLLFSWDEYDRFRKVPVNVAAIAPQMNDYLGQPYVGIPDPFGCCESYARHFEKEFESSIKRFGITLDYRYQGKEYLSGRYVPHIIHALQKRFEIYDILSQHRTQEPTEEERRNFYPVSIFCPTCHRDTVKILSLSDDATEAEYECECGHKGTFHFKTDFNCKLNWKVDWPMRWMVEGVDFEPGGKDHADEHGSYSVSKVVSKEIFGYDPPIFQGYEFIGIKGETGKMSGSSGLNLTPGVLLQVYQPEVILWLYSKCEPTTSFDFCFTDEILRQYFEFDKRYTDFKAGTANEYDAGIMANVEVEGRELLTVPMSHLVALGSVVDFNPVMLETVFKKIGLDYTPEDFAERLELAKFWLEKCSPENMNRILPEKNIAFYQSLTPEAQKEIQLLYDYLVANNPSLDDLNTFIYSVPEQVYGPMEPANKKKAQTVFFQNVYNLLIGKSKGPRLYLFLCAIEKERYIDLLHFTADDLTVKVQPVAEEPVKEETTVAPMTLAPVKEAIVMDDFTKVDLRVCQVKSCEAVKKSRNLLKLTLDDGTGERTVISGIKNSYTPEEMVGRKVIVVANLQPAKLGGTMSQGMILATSFDDGSCKVIFVDENIPNGAALH